MSRRFVRKAFSAFRKARGQTFKQGPRHKNPDGLVWDTNPYTPPPKQKFFRRHRKKLILGGAAAGALGYSHLKTYQKGISAGFSVSNYSPGERRRSESLRQQVENYQRER